MVKFSRAKQTIVNNLPASGWDGQSDVSTEAGFKTNPLIETEVSFAFGKLKIVDKSCFKKQQK